MTEVSYFWDGTQGDGGSYGHAELMDTFFRAITSQNWPALYAWDEDQGVLKGWLGELEVTDGGGLNAAITTGAAMVYGMFFESDAAETLALPNGATRYVVAQRSWAAQTVRLAAVAAITQTENVTWDVPLARVTTAGGIITGIVDLRVFCRFSTDIQDGSIVTDSLEDEGVGVVGLSNVPRWIDKGAGALKADADTPPVVGIGNFGTPSAYQLPYSFGWQFGHLDYESIWLTTKAPPDLTEDWVDVYLWLRAFWIYGQPTSPVYVGWNAWVGESGAAFVQQSVSAAVNLRQVTANVQRVELGAITVTPDSLIHMEIYRDATNPLDTMDGELGLLSVELAYSADS